MLELFAVRGQLAITLGVHATVAAAAWSVSLLAADARHRGEEGDRWHARAALAAKTAVATGALLLVQLAVFWGTALRASGLAVGLPLLLAYGLVIARAVVLARPETETAARWATVFGALSGGLGLLVLGWLSTPHLAALDADGQLHVPLQAVWTNPSGWTRVVHVGLAALATGGAIFAAGAARRGRLSAQSRALVFVVVALSLQPLAGLMSWRHVGLYQPVKAAAMGAHWSTDSSPDVQLGSWPYDFGEFSKEGVRIEGLLGRIVHGDAKAPVDGLLKFPMEGRPPVAALHLSHQGMMGMGLVAWLCAVVGLVQARRGVATPWLLRAGLLPAALLAWFLGWLVAELGRQPWTIRDLLRVGDATWLPRGIAPASFVLVSLLSLGLSGRLVRSSRRLDSST